jgi:hypothetical protein
VGGDSIIYECKNELEVPLSLSFLAFSTARRRSCKRAKAKSIFLENSAELTKTWRCWKLMPLKEPEQKDDAKASELICDVQQKNFGASK